MATGSVYSRSKTGYCRICGRHGPMTVDHIPPKSCFNNSLIYVDSPYQAQIDKGLKIRGICRRCNNNLLGGDLDQVLGRFVAQVDQNYRLYYERGFVFKKAIIETDKVKLLRGILGHVIASSGGRTGIADKIDVDRDCFANRRRRFVLGQNDAFLQEIQAVFWIHPYRSIRVVPNFVFVELFDPKSTLGGLLISFYPIGVLVTEQKQSRLFEYFAANPIIADGSAEIEMSMRAIGDSDYPFSVLRNNQGIAFLFSGEEMIHGVKSEYFANSSIVRPGVF